MAKYNFFFVKLFKSGAMLCAVKVLHIGQVTSKNNYELNYVLFIV